MYFTFHYVSILISPTAAVILSRFCFTFHYVSILIYARFNAGFVFLVLYIPLCLYFNLAGMGVAIKE